MKNLHVTFPDIWYTMWSKEGNVMKYSKLLLLALVFVLPIGLVKADPYYTNNNGVEFSEDEYRYISDLYFDGYQADMTQDEVDFTLENFGSTVRKYQVINNQLVEFDPNVLEQIVLSHVPCWHTPKFVVLQQHLRVRHSYV